MHKRLITASAAFCLAAGGALAAADSAQDTTSRRANEAPVGTQDRPPVPAEQQPDRRDYSVPNRTDPTTPTPAPDTTMPSGTTPSGTAPSGTTGTGTASPGAAPATGSQPGGRQGGGMTEAGRGAVPQGYEDLSQRYRTNGRSPRELVGRPVTNLDNQRLGTVREVVTRDGRRFAVIELDPNGANRERQVVVAFERLFANQEGQSLLLNTRGRGDLDRMPRYDARSFQPVR